MIFCERLLISKLTSVNYISGGDVGGNPERKTNGRIRAGKINANFLRSSCAMKLKKVIIEIYPVQFEENL
jgi:hypothetical protein